MWLFLGKRKILIKDFSIIQHQQTIMLGNKNVQRKS